MTADTIRQILRWTEQCTKEHDTCQQYRQLANSDDHLPLRLVNVDPYGEYLDQELRKSDIDLLSCEQAPHICVMHSQEAVSTSPDGVQYLTLSHRWSDPPPIELTWETMHQFSQQMPTSSLSACFKDAIHITRCLGIRYIWIDSICINQADPAEKASEISRMQHIYKRSQLNLSATSGESGLIFPRNPESVIPVLSRENPRKSRTSKTGKTFEAAEEFLMVSAGSWETFVDLGPLNRRAWVVQERLLAPRVLHCCYNMVYWECPCLRASEVDPLGKVDHDKVTNSVDLRTNIKKNFATASMEGWNRLDTEGQGTSFMDLLDAFHLIVRSYYFPMELTYPRDRLPAISGIARWFMSRLGFTPESYVAGLWRETLPECLLWHFFKPPKGGAVRDVEAAPSWSWASVICNGRIVLGREWGMVDGRPLIQDLRTVIVPKNGDRFAQLDAAILRLQAIVIPIDREHRNGAPHIRMSRDSKWYKESHDPWSAKTTTVQEKLRELFNRDAHRFGHRLGFVSMQKLQESFDKSITRSYVQARWDTADFLWLNETSFRPRQLYMVPLLWDWGKGPPGDVDFWSLDIRGLLLQRLPGKGQYKRVGMFMTANYTSWHNPQLTKDILRHIPMQALTKFSDGALQQFHNGRQMNTHLVADTSQTSRRQGDSRGHLMGVDDYLGVNEDGLHSIEIL